MNLRASVSLCEIWIHYVPSTTTNVTTYPLLSCGTNITRYVWGLDISGQSGGRASSQAEMQGAGGVGGLCAVFSPLLKGGGGGADGGLFYPAYDANGNITEYVDTNGVVVTHYEYDAFGNTVAKTGSMADDFKHRFSTKYLDVETGLYDYIKRPYSPKLQRFISRDPIGERGGLNLYSFCGNDPVNKVDYLGMASTQIWKSPLNNIVGTHVHLCKQWNRKVPDGDYYIGWGITIPNGLISDYRSNLTGGSFLQHAWIEVDSQSFALDKSYGFYGPVVSPDGYADNNTKKKCDEIFLNRCKYDIDLFRQKVKEIAESQKVSRDVKKYSCCCYNCLHWAKETIERAKKMAQKTRRWF